MKTVYPPKENTIENRAIRVFIPYTDIQPATLISLIGYDYQPVRIKGKFGYSNYFKMMWNRKGKFINLEHDVVVYPGALQAIWDCPEPWCAYDYHLPIHWKRNLEIETSGVPMGCMKISAKMIKDTLGLWNPPIEWSKCDQRLTQSGFKVHQHFPSVVNANPALLGFANAV